MASKTTTINGEERPLPAKRPGESPLVKSFGKIRGSWDEFAGFLSDVRAETRKVVTPSRKEVQATTSVVIVAVFIFGVYFFLVDRIFDFGLHQLLAKLGGLQQ